MKTPKLGDLLSGTNNQNLWFTYPRHKVVAFNDQGPDMYVETLSMKGQVIRVEKLSLASDQWRPYIP